MQRNHCALKCQEETRRDAELRHGLHSPRHRSAHARLFYPGAECLILRLGGEHDYDHCDRHGRDHGRDLRPTIVLDIDQHKMHRVD